ncbi:hypothetical protein DID88_008023 [Monilinia fructigena]|uniref:Uncharacterized protein n=1 Tax=Monilinia fructigena TaxID=38457 RepID=A0A395J445_9HELO|nr:hypothetical protein DID88_008023 [Monilinia fructigena]
MTISAAPTNNRSRTQQPDSIGTNHAAGTASLAFIFIFGAVYSVASRPSKPSTPSKSSPSKCAPKEWLLGLRPRPQASSTNSHGPFPCRRSAGKRTSSLRFGVRSKRRPCGFFIPETRNRDLEELDEIFNSRESGQDVAGEEEAGAGCVW